MTGEHQGLRTAAFLNIRNANYREDRRFGRLNRAFGLAAVVVGSLELLAPAAAQMMTLPGKFDVTPTGAATYAIPVAVPPGTAGVAPALQIEFTSQRGDGILGVGWALTGLPSIGRCPRTLATDGVRGTVNYDNNDRFCMEGLRLVAISGTYGADGTEYRTEIEGFTRVISHGSAGNGPSWFQAYTKSGQIMEFGHTTDSQILAQGKTTARAWGVSKVSDTKGNYFTVTYTQDQTNGQTYPSRIDYTGNANAGLSTYNSVQFFYNTARPDITPLYQAGSLVRTTVLLTDVKTYSGTTLVADYQLAYAQSTSTGRSRITSIKLCASDGSCLPATTLTWQDGANQPTLINNNLENENGYGFQKALVCDFGTGMGDILWQDVPRQESGTPPYLWLNNGTNSAVNGGNPTFSNPPTAQIPSALADSQGAFCGDFTGVGYNSVLWDVSEDSYGRSSGTRTLWLNSSTGITVVTNVAGQNGTLSGYRPYIGDFNGDGRADILWDQEDAYGRSSGKRVLWISNGDGTFTITTNLNGADGTLSGYRPLLGDFNGDGKTDILWDAENTSGQTTGTRVLWLGNGDGTFVASTNVAGQDGQLSGYVPYFADFNGDGKTDILWDQEPSGHSYSSGHRVLWISKGDGTFNVITNVAGKDGQFSGYFPLVGDFNGDGKADIFWWNCSSASYWEATSDYAFNVITSNQVASCPIGLVAYIADFSGDGKAGVLYETNPTVIGTGLPKHYLWASDGLGTDRLTKITTGLGAATTITYVTLSECVNKTVYTYETNSTYPTISIQGAIPIVSRVDASNGIGGTYSSSYTYSGARTDATGRGFLGFRQVTVKDLQTNVVQTTTFRQDYPYIALATSETKVLNSTTLNSVSSTYSATNLGGTRNFVGVSQSQQSSTDLDGSQIPTVTTTYQYDAYGNPTQIVVTTPDGYSKTTTNTYTNDTTNWFLGRLTNGTVTSVTP
jgi:hypothetical protein